jgi:hypothetical protein
VKKVVPEISTTCNPFDDAARRRDPRFLPLFFFAFPIASGDAGSVTSRNGAGKLFAGGTRSPAIV